MSEGQMVRALKLGDSGWALLGTPVQFVPQADGTIIIGICAVGVRDSALVASNEPRSALLIEFGRFKMEDVARLLAQADQAMRPPISVAQNG